MNRTRLTAGAAATAALALLLAGCPLTERQVRDAPSPTDELGEKVARLERAMDELRQPRPQPADPQTQGRLDALGQGVAELRPRVEEAERRLARVEDRADRLEKASAGDRSGERITGLEARIAALEKALQDAQARLAQAAEAAARPAPAPAEKPTAPAAAERKPTPTPESLYEEAYGLYKKQGKYEDARQKFKAFVEAYPDARLAPNAVFWIGETHFDQKQYEQAILEYDRVIQKYPKSDKVPSALLKQAFAFDALGDPGDARILLKKILREFPNTDQAALAKKKLESLGE